VAEDLPPIVVGVDGSEPSRVAMRWAADEAVRRDRPLRIVHAVGAWACVTPLYPDPVVTESITEAGRAILEQSIDDVRQWHPQLRVTTALLAEPPSVALRRQADDACEVVVGNRGLGGFAGLLLGSVGLHTAGYANCPVVVVRDGGRPGTGEIVAGIDLSTNADVALRHAFDAAVANGAGVRVVHAWRPPQGRYALPETGELAKAAAEAVREIVAPWRDRYPQVAVAETVVREHPIEALAKISADADLLVVAARGHSGMRLGSVSHGLIHCAACPVMVVHPDSDLGVG